MRHLQVVARRFVSEITRRASSEEDVDRAIQRLRANGSRIGFEGDRPLSDAITGDVHVDDRVYASIPSRAARVRFLGLLRSARQIVLRVDVASDRTHAARALVDAPRRVLRLLGFDVAEPGDRHADRFEHRFFDEEALASEIVEAKLAIVSRTGATYVLRPGATAPEHAEPFAIELARAAQLLRSAERARFQRPEEAIAAMRARGRDAAARGIVGRARLRRAIGWLDAVHPRGPSCYRRVLLELALDAGAAREPVVFGLDVGRTGHVAFKDSEERSFDVAFEIAA